MTEHSTEDAFQLPAEAMIEGHKIKVGSITASHSPALTIEAVDAELAQMANGLIESAALFEINLHALLARAIAAGLPEHLVVAIVAHHGERIQQAAAEMRP